MIKPAPVGNVTFEVYSRHDEVQGKIPWILGHYPTFEQAQKATSGKPEVWGIARREVLA